MRVIGVTSVLVLLAATAPAIGQEITIADPLSGGPLTVSAPPELPEAAHDGGTHAAIGFLMAAHAVDLSVAMYAAGRGIEVRQNPALQPYVNDPVRFALVKYGIAAAAVTSIFKLHAEHPRLARWLAYMEGGATLAIAFRNEAMLGLNSVPP